MKKLTLDLDQMDVESFSTEDIGQGEGTVLAHISDRCTGPNCDSGPNCTHTCGTMVVNCNPG
jgi:hypothetical protein